MSEYDPRCINCLHKSHEGKECPYCPLPTKDNPNSRCKEFTRADLYIARSMARIEQYLVQGHGQTIMAMSTLFDLLAEAFPEAAERLQAKLKLQQEQAQKEMEEQQKKFKEEADAALEQAKKADEERFTEELVEHYTGSSNNVLPFPKQTEDSKVE